MNASVDAAFSARLRQALVARGAPPSSSADDLLRQARQAKHKLAVTLLSAWSAEGHQLTPAQRAELAAHRVRIETYEEVWSAIHLVAPAAYVVKGPGIAAHYPAGVLRSAGDLDVVCRDPEQLWAAVAALRESGWTTAAFTVLSGRWAARPSLPRFLIELRRPPLPFIEAPLSVGLSTVDVATHLRRGPRWLSDPTCSRIATDLVSITAERWEREFTTRDLVDLTVLRSAATPADVAALRTGLAEVGLWPEWRELSREAARSGLTGHLHAGWPVPPRSVLARARLSRCLAALAWWMHPIRAFGTLAGRSVDSDHGAFMDRVADVLHSRLGAGRLLGAGLPLFGVPLDEADGDQKRVRALDLAEYGKLMIARTPAGAFLLVGGACRQEWLTQAMVLA